MARNQLWNVAGIAAGAVGTVAFGLGMIESYSAAETMRDRHDSVGAAVLHWVGDQKDIFGYTTAPAWYAAESVAGTPATLRPTTPLGETLRATDLQLILTLGSMVGGAGSFVALRK